MRYTLKLLTLSAALFTGVIFAPALQAQEASQRIEITAKRFVFTPNEITVKQGRPVTLVLKSADVGHGIRFRDFNVDVKVKAGGTAEVTFTPDKAGDFVGHCSVFCGSGHGSMQIILHVVA